MPTETVSSPGIEGGIAGVVLAAGRARRFGADKRWVSCRGEPLLAHALRVARLTCDRVLVVNRSTKETEWVLGAQGAHTTLERQHNPTLLTDRSEGGPTVLVADSENDRVIEYHRQDDTGDWRATWSYAGALSWPRDADRLPNGNTLIVDSGCDRVLVVVEQTGPRLEALLESLPADVLVCPAAREGLAGSRRCALSHLAREPGIEGALIFLGDMPDVRPTDALRLVGAMRRAQRPVRPVHEDRPGHPVACPTRWFERLAADGFPADQGKTLRCIHPGVVRDVDRPGDLALSG